MNAFTRRGACPALSAPMRTGDGLLVRLNPVAGGLTPAQLTGLCEAAARHGNGVVEVTARGSFQVRGLTLASAARLAGEVNALGISVETGVPVQTGALAGLDACEIADARPLVARIREGIEAAGLNARLGAKVSVVVDGGGGSMLDEVAADVRLTAVRSDGRVAWRVAVAGDATGASVLGEATEADACEVTIAVLEAIAAGGSEARARDLGNETFRAIGSRSRLRFFTPPSVLPDISPTRGEIGQSPTSTLPISPRVGEMSGRTEGGATERNLSNPLQNPDAFAKASRAPMTGADVALPLADSRHALPIALPFGHTDATTLIRFAEHAAGLGVSDIRLAPKRSLIALCPALGAALALRDAARALGLITDAGDPRRSISACPGAPACASGHIAARALAAGLAPSLGGFAGTIHISGCAKGCAHPAPAALTLVGSENGVGLVANGTARDRPLAYIDEGAIGEALARLAELSRRNGRTGETAGGCLARLGAGPVAAALGQRLA